LKYRVPRWRCPRGSDASGFEPRLAWFGVWGSGLGISVFGLWVSIFDLAGLGFQGFVFRVSDWRVLGFGSRVLGFRVFGFQVSGLRVSSFKDLSLGIRVSGFPVQGFRVQCFKFRVSCPGLSFFYVRV